MAKSIYELAENIYKLTIAKVPTSHADREVIDDINQMIRRYNQSPFNEDFKTDHNSLLTEAYMCWDTKSTVFDGSEIHIFYGPDKVDMAKEFLTGNHTFECHEVKVFSIRKMKLETKLLPDTSKE